MLELLKILHFGSLLGGGAAMIAPTVLMRGLVRAGQPGPPPPPVAAFLRTMGIIGLVSILVLWVTGFLMFRLAYPDGGLGALFILKLIGAATILGGSVWLNLAAARAARGGAPPPPAVRNGVTMAMRGALALVIVCAVLVFN